MFTATTKQIFFYSAAAASVVKCLMHCPLEVRERVAVLLLD